MKLQPSVKALYTCQKKLKRLYCMFDPKRGRVGGWRAVGKVVGVSGAMARLVANGHYPKDPEILKALELPVIGAGRVCPIHGVVHDKQCRSHSSNVTPAKPRTNWKQAHAWLCGMILFSYTKGSGQ